jgi:hypothetical protein
VYVFIVALTSANWRGRSCPPGELRAAHRSSEWLSKIDHGSRPLKYRNILCFDPWAAWAPHQNCWAMVASPICRWRHYLLRGWNLRPISVPRLRPRRPLTEVSNFRFTGTISRLHSCSLEGSTLYSRSLLHYSCAYSSRSASLIPGAL